MRLYALTVVLLLALPASSQVTDFGDFVIDNGSHGAWLSQGWLPPSALPDTSAWTEYDVTVSGDMTPLGCGTANTAAETSSSTDMDVIECAIDNVPAESVVYLPAGTYDLFTGNRFVEVDRNDIVIRGPDVGYLTTSNSPTAIIMYRTSDGVGGGTACGFVSDGGYIELCGVSGTGVQLSKTTQGSGFWMHGDTTIDDITYGSETCSDPEWQPGQIVKVRQNRDPDKQHSSGANAYYNDEFHVIAAGGCTFSTPGDGQLTFTRPLRDDFDSGAGGIRVDAVTLGENIGFENIQLELEAGELGDKKMLAFNGCGETCWMKRVRVVNARFQAISINSSYRTQIFESVLDTTQTSTGKRPVVYERGANDNYFYNNVIDEGVPIELQDGARGNVIAYNHITGDSYRKVFFHGDHPLENLVEGNTFGPFDVMDNEDGKAALGMAIDLEWGGSSNHGSQGPRNTFFRNRIPAEHYCTTNTDPTRKFEQPAVRCRVDDDCTGAGLCLPDTRAAYGLKAASASTNITIEYPVFLANIGTSFLYEDVTQVPGERPFETGVSITGGAYLERNVMQIITWCRDVSADDGNCDTTDWTWVQTTAEAVSPSYDNSTNNSYDRFGNEAADTGSSNDDGVVAPSGWSTFTGPDSLYLDEEPSWWCTEAAVCDFDLATGVGAFGDDITPGGTTPYWPDGLCSIPAKYWYDNGSCTLGAGAGAGAASLSGGSLTGSSIQ